MEVVSRSPMQGSPERERQGMPAVSESSAESGEVISAEEDDRSARRPPTMQSHLGSERSASRVAARLQPMANVYAPNTDQARFLSSTLNRLSSFGGACIIVGGDLNVALSLSADTSSGERRLGKYEDTRDHTPPKEGQIPKPEAEEQEEEEEEGEIIEVGQIVTTTGCVEEESHFTSESAKILIAEIMGCNRDLENIQQNINDVKNKMKNITDVLGRV
ncbi:uncharacterized protein LOC143930478 [Lithobates pipiens]